MVIMTLIALLLPLTHVFAQTPPDALASALADLGQRAGRVITLEDLSDWQWSRATYPDTSLGCPQPGQSVAQVQTEGYRILLTYNGAVFDYRAPVAGGAAFLCSGPEQVPPPPAQPAQLASTPAPAPTTSPSESSGRVVCSGAMQTRLAIGTRRRAPRWPPPNSIRQAQVCRAAYQPAQPGERFAIISGPGGDNLVWWQIEAGDWLVGAEGRTGSGGALSAPVPRDTRAVGTPAPAAPVARPGGPIFAATGDQAITASNANTLARGGVAAQRYGHRPGLVATGYVLRQCHPRYWLLDAVSFALTPRRSQCRMVRPAATLADGTLLATAHDDGTVRLWM